MSYLIKRAREVLLDIQTSYIRWEYCVVSGEDESKEMVHSYSKEHDADNINLVVINTYAGDTKRQHETAT